MRVCLGGTFDVFHDGHRLLLDKAFSIDSNVLIGLTSDRFAKKGRKQVNPYNVRKRRLTTYLKSKGYKDYRIEKIDDAYGPSIRFKDLDTIVVSEGTRFRATEINVFRKKKKFRPLEVVVVPFVLAQDCAPISSSRIRKGEVDAKGKMLRPVVVSVGSQNRNKVRATKKIFSMMFDKPRVRSVKVPGSVPEQPFGDETVKGAVERAKRALSIGGGDFGVGIEAGLCWSSQAKNYFDVQYCAIVDKMGRVTIGHGSGFCHPNQVVVDIKRGATVSEAMENATGIVNIGYKMGAIGYLTKGMLDREELTEQAVLMALVPRIRKELYL